MSLWCYIPDLENDFFMGDKQLIPKPLTSPTLLSPLHNSESYWPKKTKPSMKENWNLLCQTMTKMTTKNKTINSPFVSVGTTQKHEKGWTFCTSGNFLYIWKNKETANSNCHIDRDVCQINKTDSSAISLISMEIIKKPLMHV